VTCSFSKSLQSSSSAYWKLTKLPILQELTSSNGSKAEYGGHVRSRLRFDCDIECLAGKDESQKTKSQIEEELSFEKLDVATRLRSSYAVRFKNPEEETKVYSNERSYEEEVVQIATDSIRLRGHRNKRTVFGYDTRFSVPTDKFAEVFPFSSVVRLSTGCAGILVEEKFVLTSAHCVHDGKKYLKGVKKLRVGRISKKKRRGGKNKAGKKKVSKRQAVRKNKKKNNGQKLKWTRIREIFLPNGWIKQTKTDDDNVNALEHDYALLQLKKSVGGQPIKLGLSPEIEEIPGSKRIHFTAYEDAKFAPRLYYRSCHVQNQTSHLIYHECDSVRSSAGAGIYVRKYNAVTKKLERRVVGIYSGEQWIDLGGGQTKEYNTGVRLTELKLAQICLWRTGSEGGCDN